MDASAPPPEPPSDPVVEDGMQCSAFVHGQMTELLKGTDEPTLAMRREDAVRVKRAAARMNRALSKHARAAYQREDRLTVEIHLLKRCILKESIDREANRARVFERMRLQNMDRTQQSALDRAMASVARTEAAMAALSPTGTVQTHGASMIALFDK